MDSSFDAHGNGEASVNHTRKEFLSICTFEGKNVAEGAIFEFIRTCIFF